MKTLFKITVLIMVAYTSFAYAADDRLMYRTMCSKDECLGSDNGTAFKAACSQQNSGNDMKSIGVVYSVNAGCMCPCLYEYLYYQKPVVAPPPPPPKPKAIVIPPLRWHNGKFL